MDSFFGIGFPELVLILLLAGIVMGPQRIRQVARWLGMMTAKLQGISRTFTRQLNAELDSMDGAEELRGAMQDVQELRRQVNELRQELKASTVGGLAAGKTAVDETRESLQTILPPDLSAPKPKEIPQPANNNSAPRVAQLPDAPIEIPTPIDVPDDPE